VHVRVFTRSFRRYCDCFATGAQCNRGCTCKDCFNDGADEHSEQADKAMTLRVHKRSKKINPEDGCNCSKSDCLKCVLTP
jgi:hypothetical protein